MNLEQTYCVWGEIMKWIFITQCYDCSSYSRFSLPTEPYARTVKDPVRMWQSPIASERVKPLLQIVPHRPAKNMFTRPAVRYTELPLFDENPALELTARTYTVNTYHQHIAVIVDIMYWKQSQLCIFSIHYYHTNIQWWYNSNLTFIRLSVGQYKREQADSGTRSSVSLKNWSLTLNLMAHWHSQQ